MVIRVTQQYCNDDVQECWYKYIFCVIKDVSIIHCGVR